MKIYEKAEYWKQFSTAIDRDRRALYQGFTLWVGNKRLMNIDMFLSGKNVVPEPYRDELPCYVLVGFYNLDYTGEYRADQQRKGFSDLEKAYRYIQALGKLKSDERDQRNHYRIWYIYPYYKKQTIEELEKIECTN